MTSPRAEAGAPLLPPVDRVRRQLGSALFSRVAGPDAASVRRRIHGTPGPRWFGPDRPIRQVHGDAAMFVGGLTALLLQSLHPLAMAAVAEHSGYRSDPWGRLQRTSTFLAITTFGTAQDAEQAVARVRAVHEHVHGTAGDGRPYRADDPHLLEWVHVAEVDSFLRAHQRYGRAPLTDPQCDAYVADTARIATALGVADPPTNRRTLEDRLQSYRTELNATPACREATRFLLLEPPLPLVALPGYTALTAAAIHLLPPWARAPLLLPPWPFESVTAPLAGHTLVRLVRWAMPPPPPQQPGSAGPPPSW